MTPIQGQKVVLYLKGGYQIEGSVYEWSEDQIILSSDKDYLVVFNPTDDMIMAKLIDQKIEVINAIPMDKKVMPNHSTPLGKTETSDYGTDPYEMLEELNQEIEETIQLPSANSLRIKKLAELRKMMRDAEAEVIKSDLKTTNITPKPIQYANPINTFRRS
jgi:hypothetical protein